ncbi:hypothetical protein S245_020233 [Arachis hypogaea]
MEASNQHQQFQSCYRKINQSTRHSVTSMTKITRENASPNIHHLEGRERHRRSQGFAETEGSGGKGFIDGRFATTTERSESPLESHRRMRVRGARTGGGIASAARFFTECRRRRSAVVAGVVRRRRS